MGHRSIQVTVDIYGHAVPGGIARPSIGSTTRNYLQPPRNQNRLRRERVRR
jgi:hypothetical protein